MEKKILKEDVVMGYEEAKFKSGERFATNLKAQKAQLYRHVYYPRKNAVIEIIKSNPSGILADGDGRLYGLMPDNPVIEGLLKSSEFRDNMVEVWVYLPQEQKGTFVDRSRKRRRYLLEGELLTLPNVGDKITLYNYIDGKIHADITIHSYPERVTRTSKTAALVVIVEKFYKKKTKK